MPPPAQMRLRITRQLYESIDGIRLTSFRRGYVYEVGTTIGNYLLAVKAAEPVSDDHPYIVLPPEKHLFYPGPPTDAAPLPTRYRRWRSSPDVPAAADRPPRRRTVRRRETKRSRRSMTQMSELRARVAALGAEIARIKKDFARLRPAI
jgi:hypothetical protein